MGLAAAIEICRAGFRDRITTGAWHLIDKGRAALLASLAILFVTDAWSQPETDYRVAAIIDAGPGSKALIESADGSQRWYRSGDSLDSARIARIDKDGITIVNMGAESRLSLRGNAMLAQDIDAAAVAGAPAQTKRVQYRNLLSNINAVRSDPEETGEQAMARHLNRVLGVADDAQIASVGGVDVATATQAHAEFNTQLLDNQAIRILIDNAPTKILYIVPAE